MKLNNGLLFSTVTLALMATGCVKKQDNITASGTYNTTSNGTYNNTTTNGIYDASASTPYNPSVGTTTTLETAPPLIYDNGVGSVASTGGYTEIIPDNTVITTTDISSGQGQVVDNYSDSYSSGAFSTNSGGGSTTYTNPYSGYSETDYSSSSTTSSSSYSSPVSTSSSTNTGGGIHLQIAALKDYYAAEEFKNSLSLDPKYSAYVQRGAINKVIISGISSVNEANRLKERRFPGAFIVRNSGSSSSSSAYTSAPTPSYGGGSSYSGGGYTDNSAYGGYSSSSSSSSSYSSASSGSVGVQIGAFSSRSKAQSVANANSGHYKAVVQQGTSRGRKIYRVILTGFSSRSDAKRALASGRIANGFVTTIR